MSGKDERLETFYKTISILRNPNNQVYVSLVPPFDLSFEIDKNILKRSLDQEGLKEPQFREQSNHISLLLLAILRRQEEGFIQAYLDREELDEAEEKKERDILREELNTVKDNLYNSHLQKRYDFKKSSKAPSFTNIDWDIKKKTLDSKLDDIEFPYTTCKIIFQRIFEYPPYYLLARNVLDSVQINLSSDDRSSPVFSW